MPIYCPRPCGLLVDLDELNLQLNSAAAEAQVLELGSLMRHQRLTLCAAAQRASSLHPGLAGLVTAVGQMHTPSLYEWKKVQELWGFFAGIPYGQVVALM